MKIPHSDAAHALLQLIHQQGSDITGDARFSIWAWRECEALGFVKNDGDMKVSLTEKGKAQL